MIHPFSEFCKSIPGWKDIKTAPLNLQRDQPIRCRQFLGCWSSGSLVCIGVWASLGLERVQAY